MLQQRWRRFEDVTAAERFRDWIFKQHSVGQGRTMSRTLSQPPRPSDADRTRYDTLNSCDMLHEIIRRHHTGRPVQGGIEDLLADLRAVADIREKLAEMDGELSKRRERIEAGLKDFHETTGLDGARGGGMSVSFSDAMRPRIDPEQWDEFFKWAVATGNTQCLYKQTAAARLMEVIGEGAAVPPGVTVESYVKINARRT
jgi:hypothetical protein